MTFLRLMPALIFVFLPLLIGCNGGSGPVSPSDDPVAKFTHSAMGGYNPGESVIFDASTSSGGISKIVSYVWDWGDGSDPEIYTVPSAAHTFGDVKSFQVALTIETQFGKSAKMSQVVDIVLPGGAPVAVLNYDDPEGWNPGSRFYFDGSESYDPDNDIVSYYWEFGDGSSFGPSESPAAEYSYPDVGEFEVRLTVKDGSGRSSVSGALELSIGRPLNPEIIATYMPGWQLMSASSYYDDYTLVLDGSRVYTAIERRGLEIYDFSNSEMPEITGQAFTSDRIYEFTVRDGYAYVPDSYQGLLIYDVGGSGNANVVGTLPRQYLTCITLVGDRAFAAGSCEGGEMEKWDIAAIDISNIQNPFVTDEDCWGATVWCLDANNDYVVYSRSIYYPDYECHLYVDKRTTPGEFENIAWIEHEGSAYDIALNGKYFYAIFTRVDAPRLEIFEITDDLEVIKVNEKQLGEGNGQGELQVVGNYLYIFFEEASSDMAIYNISNPTDPQGIAGVNVHKLSYTGYVDQNKAVILSAGSSGKDVTFTTIKLW